MIVTRIKLANLRAIEAAEFRFQQGFNLVVGVNGVGKSSMLDALGICLSAVTKNVNKLRGRAGAFTPADIRIGAEALTIECGFKMGEKEHSYLVHKPRRTSSPHEKKVGLPREQVYDTPEKADFVGEIPKQVSGDEPGGRPLAVLFSTNRAVPSERTPGKGVAAGGYAAAYADAFANRELRLGEFADWMRVQEALRKDRPASIKVLSAFEDAVSRFLPGYNHLRLAGEDQHELWINHGKTELPVRYLSDGERGVLALVLDLTRRLSQANPALANPAAESEAIVLIDEIDLHLHPKWQRQIVHNLSATFPRCQFVATSHSPQVVGEVEQDRIQIIAEGQVYSPTHSYGVDSSRVLEEIMDADPRTKEVRTLLSDISQDIGKQHYGHARELLGQLIKRLGEADPEITRILTLLDFVEGKE